MHVTNATVRMNHNFFTKGMISSCFSPFHCKICSNYGSTKDNFQSFNLTSMFRNYFKQLLVKLWCELWIQTNIQVSNVDFVHRFDQTNSFIVFKPTVSQDDLVYEFCLTKTLCQGNGMYIIDDHSFHVQGTWIVFAVNHAHSFWNTAELPLP